MPTFYHVDPTRRTSDRRRNWKTSASQEISRSLSISCTRGSRRSMMILASWGEAAWQRMLLCVGQKLPTWSDTLECVVSPLNSGCQDSFRGNAKHGSVSIVVDDADQLGPTGSVNRRELNWSTRSGVLAR